jgi:hypothetical protein
VLQRQAAEQRVAGERDHRQKGENRQPYRIHPSRAKKSERERISRCIFFESEDNWRYGNRRVRSLM